MDYNTRVWFKLVNFINVRSYLFILQDRLHPFGVSNYCIPHASMSTIAAKSLKIPNVRAEKGSGTRKADLKTGPTEQLGTNGENTTNLVTRQSSTTSSSTSPDHEAGTNGTPATTPRPVSVTKTVGGSTKPAGSAPSRALRSPLSKINVTSKNSKRPEGGDGRADPLPAKASQSKTKPAATPPASDHLSKSHKGASVPTSDVTGSGFPRAAGVSRQGVPSLAATRVGSAPVPTRGAGGASRAAPAKKAATGAAAKVRESHKLEYPQSSLSVSTQGFCKTAFIPDMLCMRSSMSRANLLL